jgi:hypothetical protein
LPASTMRQASGRCEKQARPGDISNCLSWCGSAQGETELRPKLQLFFVWSASNQVIMAAVLMAALSCKRRYALWQFQYGWPFQRWTGGDMSIGHIVLSRWALTCRLKQYVLVVGALLSSGCFHLSEHNVRDANLHVEDWACVISSQEKRDVPCSDVLPLKNLLDFTRFASHKQTNRRILPPLPDNLSKEHHHFEGCNRQG